MDTTSTRLLWMVLLLVLLPLGCTPYQQHLLLLCTAGCRPGSTTTGCIQWLFMGSGDGDDNLGVEGNCCDFQDKYTDIDREMQWSGNVGLEAGLPLSKETELLNSGVLIRRGEFCKLQGDRLDEVNEAAQRLGMTCSQAQSIRHQYMVQSFGYTSSERLDRQLDRIHLSFEKRVPILKLSYQLDQPPVNIFRALVKDRLRQRYSLPRSSKVPSHKVRSVIQGQPSDLLDVWEKTQLAIAKQNDVVTYETPEIQARALEWESVVQDYLEQEGINFLSEDEIRLAGCNKTPDFLLLDNVFIDQTPVRWIEVKTLFPSGLRKCGKMHRKKLKRQVRKYETTFDEPGAVVFLHGYSESVPPLIPNTLCLGAGALVDNNISDIQQQSC